MATPKEKLQKLRLPFTDSKDPYYKEPKAGSYGGKEGPLTEALRAKRARQAARKDTVTKAEPEMEEPSKSSKSVSSEKTFKEAFAEARAAGKETFTWRGKKYTTELAGGKKQASEESFSSSEPEVTDTEEGTTTSFMRGGRVKMSSASRRADGCAKRGKTRGRLV